MIKRKFKKYLSFALNRVFREEIEKDMVLKAKNLAFKNNKLKKIKNFSEIEFQVFSQWGEDGIIDWIISKVNNLPKKFLEIGTENYKESNTRYLLISRNWDGFIIESDKKAVSEIKSQKIYWKHNLKIKNQFISKENINRTIKSLKVPKKIGFLSLDIDGIDYWILKELKDLDPIILTCEYNSLFGSKKSITVPYKKKFYRNKEHYSNLYFGASISAFINLLKKRNYIFLGTNSSGNNAFFIKKNFSVKLENAIKEKKIFLGKFRESRNRNGGLNYLNKEKSLKLIKNKSVVDLDTNKLVKISDLKL